ncbi:ABC transporter ATP-binding protein [Natronoglycomyces albus]|uniref:ATP-binding cassette domain-containing protein n=1 Tax=Natronoglycomyces albus TaxID=2811108 RepID=A0A895XZ82_9ACTN|nr:ATP-binding cassette domain-containing protein [Natronoglycomyces albus]
MVNQHSNLAIEVSGLRKKYGQQHVLRGIDFSVEPGAIFGMLGPNGAGKTTTVKILSTLASPDSGRIRVAGADPVSNPKAVRSAIGVTGQFSAIDDLLTGEENLRLMADLHHLDRSTARTRISDLLERFDLTSAAKKKPSSYSGGMRRRLDVAMGLMGSPQIIFLDEPTTGVDPRGRKTMWDIVRNLAEDGITVFLTTQYLEEADELADHIALLDDGHIVAEGTPEELKASIPGGHIELRFNTQSDLTIAENTLRGSERFDSEIALRVSGGNDITHLRGILQKLDEASVPVANLSIHSPDLDDVFLELTSQPNQTKRALA